MEEKEPKKEKKKVLSRRGILWSYALMCISPFIVWFGEAMPNKFLLAFGVVLFLIGLVFRPVFMCCPHCDTLINNRHFNPFADHGGYCHKCGGELPFDRKFRE